MKLRDEDGQALLLALAFLVLFSFVIAAILTFGEASVLSTTQLKQQRNVAYAADGATDGAIQYVRGTTSGAGTCSYSGSAATLCGLWPGDASTCPAATSSGPVMFQWTMDPDLDPATTADGDVSATVTCQTLTQRLELDRTVIFRTSVAGVVRVIAKVIYRDSASTTVTCGLKPCVSIQSWTYCRAGGDPNNATLCRPS